MTTASKTAPVPPARTRRRGWPFLAKVCAAAVVVSLPLTAGFAAQDKLVQGLSMGAVK